jgi:MinD superfamily P-loop ATPase
VNKSDLNLDLVDEIDAFCVRSQATMTASIPFDESVTKAIQQGVPLVEFNDGMAAHSLTAVWQQVKGELMTE